MIAREQGEVAECGADEERVPEAEDEARSEEGLPVFVCARYQFMLRSSKATRPSRYYTSHLGLAYQPPFLYHIAGTQRTHKQPFWVILHLAVELEIRIRDDRLLAARSSHSGQHAGSQAEASASWTSRGCDGEC
jgi:hypothetical protein